MLSKVLCVQTFHCNLIFISKLTAASSVFLIFPILLVFKNHSLKKMVETGKANAGLYTLNIFNISKIHSAPFLEAPIWLARLGHTLHLCLINYMLFLLLVVLCLLLVRYVFKLNNNGLRLSFVSQKCNSYSLFDLIHCDLWDPYKHYTHEKCNSIFTLVEEFFKCTWVYLITNNSHVATILQSYSNLISDQFHVVI